MGEEVFWHVTPKEKMYSILIEGIRKSEDGHYGDGVYCIKKNDYNSLDVLLNSDMYKDNGIESEDLCIVEFSSKEKYEIHIPVIRGYRDEKWIVIQKKIDAKQIVQMIDAENFIHLKQM